MAELRAIKAKVQDPQQTAHFSNVLEVVKERVFAFESQVDVLRSDFKSMFEYIGIKLNDILSNNATLNKSLDAIMDKQIQIDEDNAEEMSYLRNEMADLKQKIDRMPAKLTKTMINDRSEHFQKIEAMNSKLNTLLETCYDLPTFISVWRHNSTAWEAFKKVNPSLEFTFTLHIRFHCEYTLEAAPKVFEVQVTKEWVSERSKCILTYLIYYYLDKIIN